MLISKIGAGAAIGTALVLIAGTAQAQGGWTTVAIPPTGVNAALTAAAATSDTNAWAVGHSNTAPNFLGAVPVIDHWNGSAWSQMTAPSTGYSTNTLSAVGASGSADAWAVGWSEPRRYTFYPLGLHWNGTAWSVSTSFNTAMAGQVADGVADISTTNAYAIGGGLGSAPYGIVARWNGTTWNRLTVPVPPKDITTDFSAISADRPNDVWIVGFLHGDGLLHPGNLRYLRPPLEREFLERRLDAGGSIGRRVPARVRQSDRPGRRVGGGPSGQLQHPSQ